MSPILKDYLYLKAASIQRTIVFKAYSIQEMLAQ